MQRRIITVVAAAAVVVAGCSSSKNDDPSSSPAGGARTPTSAAAVRGTVTVLAAASLKEAFTTLATQFQSAHPGTHVKLSFGASSDLAEQVNQGAPADVFASASPKNMQQVVSAGGASASTNFAKNVMEVAVPPSNPAQVSSVTDLANSSVKVALCEPQVPCGAVAAEVFANANITVKPVTLRRPVRTHRGRIPKAPTAHRHLVQWRAEETSAHQRRERNRADERDQLSGRDRSAELTSGCGL